jgi:hypothetical protein
MPKTCGGPVKYTMWMEWKTKEESLASPVFSVYNGESDNSPSDFMLPTWGKTVLSWDTPGCESSIQRLIGKKEDSLAKESNLRK